MSHEEENGDRRRGAYKFNQNLLIWPFVIGVSALIFYTTSYGFSLILIGNLQDKIIAYAMSLLLVIMASYSSVQLGGALAKLFLGRSGDGRYGNRVLVPFILFFMITASATGLFSYMFWYERFDRIYEKTADGPLHKRMPINPSTFERSIVDLRAATLQSTIAVSITSFVGLSILSFKILTYIVSAKLDVGQRKPNQNIPILSWHYYKHYIKSGWFGWALVLLCIPISFIAGQWKVSLVAMAYLTVCAAYNAITKYRILESFFGGNEQEATELIDFLFELRAHGGEPPRFDRIVPLSLLDQEAAASAELATKGAIA